MFRTLITTAAVVMVVAVGAATAGTTPQGLKADGLRYQAMAERYQQMRHYTPQALQADGLRWQALARAYATQRKAVVVFHGPSVALLDTPVWAVWSGKHQLVRFRYALLVGCELRWPRWR